MGPAPADVDARKRARRPPPPALPVAVVTVLVVLLAADGAAGVQITELHVPPVVRNGSSAAVLDCEYSLRADELRSEAGLVVKWYFNNGPSPVYQWIPGGRPQDLGVLRGRLDVQHRATDNRATMHRALYIVNPTTDLSGEYKCHVSTFVDEDFMTKKMVVYVPQQTLELTDRRPATDAVNLSCQAQGVYPEPKMALYRDNDRMDDRVSMRTARRGGVFDITASALLDERTLQSPTVFDCELRIPDANYHAKKSIIYYGGIFSTPTGSLYAQQLSPAEDDAVTSTRLQGGPELTLSPSDDKSRQGTCSVLQWQCISAKRFELHGILVFLKASKR